jgi:hypothetical protein
MAEARGRVEPCRGKEISLAEATKESGLCQVRSKTDRPCPRLAVVELWGIPFCERCAREQEAYFTIGELTQEEEALGLLHDELLIEGVLHGIQRERVGCVSAAEKAKVTVGSPE